MHIDHPMPSMAAHEFFGFIERHAQHFYYPNEGDHTMDVFLGSRRWSDAVEVCPLPFRPVDNVCIRIDMPDLQFPIAVGYLCWKRHPTVRMGHPLGMIFSIQMSTHIDRNIEMTPYRQEYMRWVEKAIDECLQHEGPIDDTNPLASLYRAIEPYPWIISCGKDRKASLFIKGSWPSPEDVPYVKAYKDRAIVDYPDSYALLKDLEYRRHPWCMDTYPLPKDICYP